MAFGVTRAGKPAMMDRQAGKRHEGLAKRCRSVHLI